MILPFFNNSEEELEKEVEIVLMQKGKMRG
jgi:hypothetical protein